MDRVEVAAIIVGMVVSALTVVRLYVVNPILRVRDDIDNMEKVRKDISGIYHELQRNGGSTVKDAVIRMEESQVRTEAGLNEIKHRLDEHINFHLQEGHK